MRNSAGFISQGFTSIELVTVIVLIEILAAVAIPRFINLKATADNDRAMADLQAPQEGAT